MNTARALALLVCLVFFACGEKGDQSNNGDAGAVDSADDAGSDTTDSGARDVDLSVPLIGDVLGCGRVGTAGGLASGDDLQRHTLDTTAFSDALCNDGTAAVMYFRPFNRDENRNRWVIMLQGGGSCGSGDECAKRWCMVDTNFSMHGMTSSIAPTEAINGNGLLARRTDNPLGPFNQVFVKYCSSDSWNGTARDAVTMAQDTRVGGPIAYRIHFLGGKIFDAVIATLRREGVGPLTFTRGNQNVEMPDLDEASQVVLAGGSAGGVGTLWNVDRLANTLGSGTVVRGLADSAFFPAREHLDLSTTAACAANGICDWEQLARYQMTLGPDFLSGARNDDSCRTWHMANMPDALWHCSDISYVTRNHITTPMFFRMGQRDENISENFIQSMISVPGRGLMTIDLFAELVRAQLGDLANIQATANEGSAIATIPGVFAPTCTDHETLTENDLVYTTTIESGGTNYDLPASLINWSLGQSPSALITQPGGTEHCP